MRAVVWAIVWGQSHTLEDKMIASEHTRIYRAARWGFSWSGNRLSAVTVIFAAFVVWSSGCGNDPNHDEQYDYGICFAKEAPVSGVQYGDREPDEGEILAAGSYVCAPSYKMNSVGGWSGEIECLDPATGTDEWGSVDWGMELALSFPSEICACTSVYPECALIIRLIFDEPADAPEPGAVYDLTQARLVESIYIAGGADYAITGGTVEFVTVEANRYSFKIHDLVFTRIQDEGVEETFGCYIPDTVTIESISIDCVPTVENMYC